MIRLIALTTMLLASPSFAQFADFPGLADGLKAIRFQSQALKDSVEAQAKKEKPDVSKYPIWGADLSRYEKSVDWEKMKTSGMSFVFIQATHGLSFVDGMYQSHWKGSRGTGIKRSAYHFYDFCKSGAAQADYFIRTVPKEYGLLPMVIDLEQNDLCKKMPAKPAFRKSLAAFVKKVTARYGLKPILYINGSIYNQYLEASDDYKYWIADPNHKSPEMPGGRAWAFWQYDWHGKAAGVDGEVDLDVFNGSPEQLAQLEQPGDSSGLMYASLR